MRKEYNVCITLKKWFNTYGIDCWLNEEKDKFTTKGCRKKPDMVIYSYNLNQYVAIEVKSGDDKNAIRSGVKIIDYWADYTNKKTKYFIKDEEIKISSFCFATLGAMNGKVFLEDGEPIDSLNDPKTNWKLTQLKYKLEPHWEYPKAKEYLRLLWANWRRIRKKNQPGLGIILADILNYSKIDQYDLGITPPLLFDMQWRMSFRNKEQWRQKNFKL